MMMSYALNGKVMEMKLFHWNCEFLQIYKFVSN